MSQRNDIGTPTVFMSYGTVDQATALQIRQDLVDRGVEPFLDVVDIGPGEDVVWSISDALTRADFYVLLWSAAARDRYWVMSEISAALVKERNLSRPFVFIVRLDDSELPLLLAPRRYLDAFDGRRNTVADQLAAIWRRDRELGATVAIAPSAPPTPMPAEAVRLVHVYANNRALSVAHEMVVPEHSTSREIVAAISKQLELPDELSRYGGKVGVRFRYRFLLAGRPIDAESEAPVRLADGSAVDIEVTVTPFGPEGAMSGATAFLPTARREVAPMMIRELSREAFRHMTPDEGERRRQFAEALLTARERRA